MKRIYFDYAASTPVDPRVLKAMAPYFSEKFGNPGSLHSFGQEAIAAVDEAREKIAGAIGAESGEIIFTGSATEANNLALRGALGACGKNEGGRPRIIISAIEHESVMETAMDLEHKGTDVVYLAVDKNGSINPEELRRAINGNTILVSLMYANNEIGTIEPIADAAKIISGLRRGRYPLFHTDAVQAFQFLDCNVKRLGVDLMTISAHKIYGPKGVGALYVGNSLLAARSLLPAVTGGGQEFGLRSGTENTPLIAGFGEAARLAAEERGAEAKRISELRDRLWRGIRKIYPKAEINGPEPESGLRLPNNLNVYFPDFKSEELLSMFDLAGLAVSAGAACRSRASKGSYVVEALGLQGARPTNSVRFSLGRPTAKTDVEKSLTIIKRCFS